MLGHDITGFWAITELLINFASAKTSHEVKPFRASEQYAARTNATGRASGPCRRAA